MEISRPMPCQTARKAVQRQAPRTIRGPGRLASILLLAGLVGPQVLSAQIRVSDLVVTTGFAAEGYSGNLASVTVPVVDSTDRAHSTIGQIGVRGELQLFEGTSTSLWAGFDVGIRQFVAGGFSFRDYSPREKAGRANISLIQGLGRWGNFSVSGMARARSVNDRPPMPLYLQAGFDQVAGSFRYQTPILEGVRFDLQLDAERADFEAAETGLTLNLLDRRSRGMELGAEWGESWTIRFFGGARRTEYPQQGSFDPSDPFRRDRMVNVGGTWSYASSFLAEIGVVGTVNRSNSLRPEYDAVSLTADFLMPLPFWGLGMRAYGVLTGKSYVQDTEFARLVPGEEADNASIVYLDLTRQLADNLDTTLRLGWTRAETDIGDSYYERYGATLLFNYRPFLR